MVLKRSFKINLLCKFFPAVFLLFGTKTVESCFFNSPPLWNNLKTTYAPDGLFSWVPFYSSDGYKDVPRTEMQAIEENWVMISDNCLNNGQFYGYRYVFKPNPNFTDFTVATLYDLNGIIAGIQMNIAVKDVLANPKNTYKFDKISMFQRTTIRGIEMYTLTSYFVDPAIICLGGRRSADLEVQGTGNKITFQNGPTPGDLIVAPFKRADAIAEGWSNNDCFIGMGTHNFYKEEENDKTNCDYSRPVFLLYTKNNELSGFGFSAYGIFESPRFEHPDEFGVKLIVGETVSKCKLEKSRKDSGIGVTTMHVFFLDSPEKQNCFLHDPKSV